MDGWALFIALGLLAAFAGLSLAARRGLGPARAAAGPLRLRARIPLAPGVWLLHLEVAGRPLLVTRDKGGLRLLEAPPAAPPDPPPDPPPAPLASPHRASAPPGPPPPLSAPPPGLCPPALEGPGALALDPRDRWWRGPR